MDAQDYSARVAYRPPAAWYRRANRLGVVLTSLGLAPRDAVTLEVKGRRSGAVRRTPLVRTRVGGSDYLVALAGESQWVRNVRAAAGRARLRRGRGRDVRLDEVDVAERADVIAAYLEAGHRRGGAETERTQARAYFGLEPGASRAEIAAVAAYYPVFRITSMS